MFKNILSLIKMARSKLTEVAGERRTQEVVDLAQSARKAKRELTTIHANRIGQMKQLKGEADEEKLELEVAKFTKAKAKQEAALLRG